MSDEKNYEGLKWYCKNCNADVYIADDSAEAVCEKCGGILVLSGSSQPAEAKEAEFVTAENVTVLTESEKNELEKKERMDISNIQEEKSEVSFKKLLIIFAAILIAFFLVRTIYNGGNDDITTAPVLQNEETETTAPVIRPVIPDFLNFATVNASQKDYEFKEDEGLEYIYYKLNADSCELIVKEYVDYICEEYDFKLNNRDEENNWYGLKFIGTGTVGMFYTEFSGGAKYHDNSLTLQTYYENGELILKIVMSELVDLVQVDKLTSYSTASNALMPDFKAFAGKYVSKFKTVETDSESYYTDYYELDSKEHDYVVDEYVKLLTEEYNFELLHDVDSYNWKGLKYNGTKEMESFNTEFSPTDDKYENTNLTIYIYAEDDRRVIEMTVSKALDIVNTSKRAS